ncbi:hypothetical protein BC7_00040 [Bacillus phage BC-7]|nr:hypothetical protein BC7_00040 [Bacillus phage BC-7]
MKLKAPKLWRLWKANKEYNKAMEMRHYHNTKLIVFAGNMSQERFDHHVSEVKHYSELMQRAKEELLK